MKDVRKNVKVSPLVKEHVETLKGKLNLKTESEVIQYLVFFYDEFWVDLNLPAHQQLLEKVKEYHRRD